MTTDTKDFAATSRIETHHHFPTPAAAWEFMRLCHANGLMAGYPGLGARNTVRVLRPASRGHLALLDHGTQEAFEECGEVFFAPTGRPLDIQGRRQGARWMCSRSYWDRYFDTLFAARVASSVPAAGNAHSPESTASLAGPESAKRAESPALPAGSKGTPFQQAVSKA